jgi:hypothetical protein
MKAKNAEGRIGEAVYRAFVPVQCGKIIATHEGLCRGVVYNWATVRWLSGKVTTVRTLELKNLASLVEEHRSKLALHETALAKVDAMNINL